MRRGTLLCRLAAALLLAALSGCEGGTLWNPGKPEGHKPAGGDQVLPPEERPAPARPGGTTHPEGQAQPEGPSYLRSPRERDLLM